MGFASPSGVAITDAGGASVPLSGIAYRPETGAYFDYSDDTNIVYSRNVTTNDENRVFFPAGHPGCASARDIVRVTDLFDVAGDVNEGVNPSIFANAYTNAIPCTTATAQFVLDTRTDSLATLGNDVGTLTMIGKIALDGKAIDFSTSGGMDILSMAEGHNRAYAILNTSTGAGLYALNLFPNVATGLVDATCLRGYRCEFRLSGLTVAPAAAPVPAAGLPGRRVLEALPDTVPARQIIAAVRNPAAAANLAARGVIVRTPIMIGPRRWTPRSQGWRSCC